MLARERCCLADAAADGCTALAAALATLPSGSLEKVADALAALGVECDVERPSGATRNLSSLPEVQRPPPAPKSSPATVTELPPLTADLRWNARSYAEVAAESKLKPSANVPVTPPTLAADSPNIVPFELLRQERVVAEVYVDVQQASTSCMLIAVGSPAPESSPAPGAAPKRERVPMRITAPDGRVSQSSDPL